MKDTSSAMHHQAADHTWATMDSSGQACANFDRQLCKSNLSSRLRRSAWRRWAFAIIAFLLVNHAHAESKIVVSLKPIHSLVECVMHGVGEPILLVTDGAHPHGHLTSETVHAAIHEADIIIWMGQPADAGLTAAIVSRRPSAHLVTLADIPDVVIPLSMMTAHAWLDPRNAIAMVETIATTLSHADPDNAGVYRGNAAELRNSLQRLDADLRVDLAHLRQTPFLIYDDAFQLFTRRYGLEGAYPLVIDPALRQHLGGIDAALLRSLRTDWQRMGIRCLFLEPRADHDFVRLLVDDIDILVTPLDPYGTGLPTGPKLYGDMMRAVSGSIVRCAANAS
ncbi:MAG: zinc ABC transporter substrate-binding protein [Alphaproteobacteria bacterium]|nr:zinc ABC transporter substrate-binding protein [Alphaproteobacteria bacterium]